MEGTSPKGGAWRSDRAAPRSGLDEPAADGVADESGRLVDAQLRHDARPVGLGGLHADSQECRHLLGRLSFRHQLQNLALARSEEHTSELQSLAYLVCRLLLEKKKIYIRL